MAAIAAFKYFTACPTCPHPEVFGLDAAVAGSCLFMILAVLSGLKVNISRVLAPIMGSVLIWQTVSWWATKLQCLPCTFIAALATVVGVSSLSWDDSAAAFVTNESKKTLWLAWSAAGLALASVWLSSAAQPQLPATGVEKPLAGFGYRPVTPARSITELGLAGTGKRRVILLAMKGCSACEKSEAALSAAGVSSVELAYIGSEPPNRNHPWLQLTHPEKIRATPTVLFIAENGTIEKARASLDYSVSGIAAFAQEVEMFKSGAKHF